MVAAQVSLVNRVGNGVEKFRIHLQNDFKSSWKGICEVLGEMKLYELEGVSGRQLSEHVT